MKEHDSGIGSLYIYTRISIESAFKQLVNIFYLQNEGNLKKIQQRESFIPVIVTHESKTKTYHNINIVTQFKHLKTKSAM